MMKIKMKIVKFMMMKMSLKWIKKKLRKKNNKMKIVMKFNPKKLFIRVDSLEEDLLSVINLVVEECLVALIITLIINNNNNSKNLKNLSNMYLFVKLQWVNIKL